MAPEVIMGEIYDEKGYFYKKKIIYFFFNNFDFIF